MEDDSQRRELEDIKQKKQEMIKDNRNLYQERKGENGKLGLNPNAPDFIGSREQNEGNENIILQQSIKCYNCWGKDHLRLDCWYSQGNANGGY